MGNQDELDTFYSVAIRNHHGKCENQADVVRNKELHNWMLSASLPLDQRIYIMMLSSVVTCPSMTALFHELLKQRTDHILSFASTCAAFCIDLRGVAKSILEKFSERGLSEIAKPEIQAFTMRPGCTPSASNIDKVVDGFWNNHRKIDAFVEQLAAATTGGSIFNEREVYDNLHVTLSTCGGGYGPYQAARFLRLWFFIHGKVDLPGRPTPTTMADGLYDVIPQHLRGLVPTGVTALQYGFEICMRNKDVRNVDPEMVKKLREAYYSQAVRAAAAPRDDLGSDDSDDDVQARGRAAEENTNTHDGDDSDASTVRDHPTKTRDHPKTSNGVPTCAESASTSSDDDDQTNGVARGEGESDETHSSNEDNGRAGGFLVAAMDDLDLRLREARGAYLLQKDDDDEGFGGGGDDDDTGNSEPSADAETPREAPALSSGRSGATQGSSERKRKAKKLAQKHKKAKAARTSERLAAADNDGIPVQSTSKYRAVNGKGALVCGSKNTCQCDAVAMALHSHGAQLPRFAARNAMMPTWRSDAEATGPGMDAAQAFYKTHGYVARADGDLCSNPLALLRRTHGVYHLETLLTLLGDDGKVALGDDNKPIERKHAAVFVASEPWSECGASGVGVLKDNQSDVKPVCITSSDREDKAGALEAFKLLWPNHRMMLINAYEVTAI